MLVEDGNYAKPEFKRGQGQGSDHLCPKSFAQKALKLALSSFMFFTSELHHCQEHCFVQNFHLLCIPV
jgi:hypothetical protein